MCRSSVLCSTGDDQDARRVLVLLEVLSYRLVAGVRGERLSKW